MALVQEIDYRIASLDLIPQLRPLGNLVFLDSALERGGRGRYSYIVAAPSLLVNGSGHEFVLSDVAGARSERLTGDALRLCDMTLQCAPETDRHQPGLPPFRGGWCGYLGYEVGAALEGVEPAPGPAPSLPGLILGWYDWVVAWDHAEKRAWYMIRGLRPEFASVIAAHKALGSADGGSVRFTAVKLDKLGRMLARHIASVARGEEAEDHTAREDHEQESSAAAGQVVPGFPLQVRSNFSRQEYLEAVDRVRDLILAGDIFQANISQRFTTSQNEDTWVTYLRLRQESPGNFAAYVEFGTVCVLSASPEMFLSLDTERNVITAPIKGTRPLTGDAGTDARARAELLASRKDRSENLMIVDLLRNDLSRVCEAGSVYVPRLFDVEEWSGVQHLVSTVNGRLREGQTAIDLVRAAFPGGSITGAPKIRAMQIIAELERGARGVYCGSIGYFAADGGAMLNIAIRTVQVSGGMLHFSAGGGIVADSRAVDEYDETLTKAEGLLRAVAPDTERVSA